MRSSDLSIVPSIGYVAESLCTLLISYLTTCLSYFNIILIFSTVFSAGLFFSSYIENLQLFSWVYGLSIGALSASVFLPSLWIIWGEIPESKSLTSGVLLSGYSLGSVPFGLMFTFLANPHNHKADTIDDDDKMFPREVASRVPMTIRWVSASYLIFMLVGLFMLPRKQKVKEEEKESKKMSSLKEIFRNKRFWLLFITMYLAMVCQGYALFLYKVIAIQYINDDYYSSFVGMASFVCTGVGRFLFGYLFNIYYWKKIMSLVYFIETILMGGMWFTVEDKSLYAFFMILYQFFTSSFYNIVLLMTEKAFPGNKQIISCVCLSFIPAFFTPYLLSKFLQPLIGFGGCFGVVAACTFILFFCTVFYKEPEVDETTENLLI